MSVVSSNHQVPSETNGQINEMRDRSTHDRGCSKAGKAILCALALIALVGTIFAACALGGVGFAITTLAAFLIVEKNALIITLVVSAVSLLIFSSVAGSIK
jgi:hypothetical protein